MANMSYSAYLPSKEKTIGKEVMMLLEDLSNWMLKTDSNAICLL